MTTTTIDVFKYRPEDGGVLDCLMDLHGQNWLYVAGFEAWYYWTGTHWAKDECQRLRKLIQKLLDVMNAQSRNELASIIAYETRLKSELIAAEANDNSETIVATERKLAEARSNKERIKAYVSATTRSSNRVASIEGMAQAQRAIAADQLDTANVLNLKNGTLDLDTLTLRPHCREDYLTYQLGYEYDENARAPRFERFVSEVFVKEGTTETDEDLCYLYQAALGLSMTNDTRHEAMFFLSGSGGNGKTVVISIIQALLNGMACSVDFSTIGQPGNYDLADVQGKRVIFSTESERGGKAAEGYIKRIVSGERINARAIYGKPFEFKSTAKIWWAMNDKPIIEDTGNAIWRRMKLIPFNRIFSDTEKDVDLLSKLLGELPGILNFALDGLRRLRQRGRLPESAAVNDAIREYRHESNTVAQWKDERTVVTPTANTPASTLYEDYRIWSDQNGRKAFNSTNFGKELKRLGIAKRENARHSEGLDEKQCHRYSLGLLFVC